MMSIMLSILRIDDVRMQHCAKHHFSMKYLMQSSCDEMFHDVGGYQLRLGRLYRKS